MGKKGFAISQKVNTDVTPDDFDIKKHLYASEYSLCRPSANTGYYSTPLFEQYCETLPANLDYATINTIAEQNTIYTSSVKRSNFGISKVIVKKGYTNQPGVTYNEDYITQNHYTDGNEFVGACLYYITKTNQNYVYLNEFIDEIEANPQLRKSYYVSAGGDNKQAFAMFHGTTGWVAMGKPNTIDTINHFNVGIDTTNDQLATLTNLQSITAFDNVRKNYYFYNNQTTQPWESRTGNVNGHAVVYSAGGDLTRILQYPVIRFSSGRVGTYNNTVFYFYHIIIALPKSAVIPEKTIFGGAT